MLAKHNQMLPFEPMDHRVLFGTSAEPTIGGIVAGNVSGPRRIAVGACRDSLIGVRLVTGRGDVVKSGGRVMKNVTGLDLVKLNCGAWGTLGVLSEVIFKVLPKPARSLSVGLGGMNDTTAIAALTAALGSSFAVSAAAHIPASIGSDSTTIVRLEGSDGSVAYGARELAKLWRSFGRAELIEGDESANLWLRVRDAHWLAQPMDRSIWRLSLAPSKAPHVLADIRQKLGVRYFFDWGGSLVWLAVVDADDAGASVVREAMVNTGGHATLVRASSEIRRRIDVFEPLPPAVLKLTQEIKKCFDPDRVLNFGRMYAGI
jgi:glycolate oxidase FAD binding subunit